MKPEDKAVVQQALEALEMFSPKFPPLVYTETDRKRDEAITALRQLLEQPEPVQELQRYSPDGEGGMEVDSLGAYVKLREKNGY